MPRVRRNRAAGAASAAPTARPLIRSCYARLALTLVAAVIASALALPATGATDERGAASARNDGGLCPVLDLIPPLACREPGRGKDGGPSAAGAAAAPADESDRVRRTSTTVRYDSGRIAVTFAAGVTQKRIDAVFARAGVSVEQAVPAIRAYMVATEPSRVATALVSLRESSAVDTAGEEVLADALDVSPNDTGWPQQWGLRVVGIPQAWSLVKTGAKPTVVAVVDTGVDPAQADLRGALVPGYDFVHNTTNPLDDHGHGTAVAGVIAARTDNLEGIAGVCGTCLVMPVKVLDSEGVGDDSVIAAGVVWAVDHGAKVINLSLGGPGTAPSLDNAVSYAVRKGVFVVAAAGNSSSTTPFYPAASPQAVGVAATTEGDAPYSWSNSGSWVKFAAPGCNLAPFGNDYETFCGTSSATPIVAGLAGLSLEATPNATPEQLEQALAKSAVAVPGFVQFGRVDAPGTLSALVPPPPPQAKETTVVLKGTLTARRREQSFTRTVQAGRVTATVTFKRARSLTLTLIPQDPSGETLRVSGSSPLRIDRVLPTGTIKFVVRGALNTTTFILTITNRPA
jgi:subtilisin family serine protease